MRRFSDRNNVSTLSELNVTPLLDLAFVLLIIFMITTPLMEKSVDLVVPSSTAADRAVNPADINSVAINKYGLLTLNDEPVDTATLATRLTALHNKKPDTAVVIRSHKELPVQKLVDVLSAVKAAQISKVGVVTVEE